MYESGSKWNCSPTCTTVCRRTLTGMTIAAARVFHVNVNCSDLERSLAFYRAVGLTPATRTRPEGPQAGAAFGRSRRSGEGVMGLWFAQEPKLPRQPGRPLGLAQEIELREMLLRAPASGFMVELTEWQPPGPRATPPRLANQLGIFRMAWL